MATGMLIRYGGSFGSITKFCTTTWIIPKLGCKVGEASHPEPSATKQFGRLLSADGRARVGETFQNAWADEGFVEKILKYKE